MWRLKVVNKPTGKVIKIALELKGNEDLIEEAMLKALDVMKNTKTSLRFAYTTGCLAFVFEKNGEMLIELLYSREEILKMDFDKVELKTFIDNAYRFKAHRCLVDEVHRIHSQIRASL